jgi:transcription elongation GreA/GreB family factor
MRGPALREEGPWVNGSFEQAIYGIIRAVRDSMEAKRAMVSALLAKLEAELGTMRRAAKDAREAATHEEAKPENDKDTRALEASYLAGAQAARVRELEGAIKAIAAMPLLAFGQGAVIQASAVVTLEDEAGESTVFFVAPFGGGTTVSANGIEAHVLSPQSPRGRALLGRSVGDVIEAQAARPSTRPVNRELTIVDVW